MDNNIYKSRLIDSFLEAFKEYEAAQVNAFREDHYHWEYSTRNDIGWRLRDYYPHLDESQRAYFDRENDTNVDAATRKVSLAAQRLYKIMRDMKEEELPVYQDFADEVYLNLAPKHTEERIVF